MITVLNLSPQSWIGQSWGFEKTSDHQPIVLTCPSRAGVLLTRRVWALYTSSPATFMPPNPPQTPLRRLSQGSLFRLSRSGTFPDAPHGLGFLEPALAELIDEAEALQTNVEGLRNLDNALGTFNESFASWLYVMQMNALTTDWPQVRFDLYWTPL